MHSHSRAVLHTHSRSAVCTAGHISQAGSGGHNLQNNAVQSWDIYLM